MKHSVAAPAVPRLRENNFDFLRFVFATMVFFVHLSVLTDGALGAGLASFLSAEIAVKAFFVISGFLIFRSGETSKTMKDYALKRVRRIYPGYATVVLASAGLLFFASTTPEAYFSPAWARYLLANLSFLNFLAPVLPGVFDGNPHPEINGALWTLKIEAMFYVCVPFFIFLMRRWGRWPVLAALYIVSIAYAAFFAAWAARSGNVFYAEMGRQLPGQLSYFVAGATIFYALPFFEKNGAALVLLAAFVLGLHSFLPLFPLEPAALAVAVLFAAFAFPLGRWGKYGDFSYGVYIVHFPVIQLFWASGLWRDRPVFLSFVIAGAVLFLAVLLWHGVEKRVLGRTSHYVKAST